MKLVVVLLALLLAGGLWWLLRGEDTSGGDTATTRDPADLSPELLYLTRGTEAVTLWVKAPDGTIPPGAELGLRYKDKVHWLYADEHGRRLFTGAPVGTIEAVARAPGYEERAETLTIQAGFMDEKTLVIRQKK